MTNMPDASSATLIEQSTLNGVATITLNRPDKLNSFNSNMAKQLLTALRTASTDVTCRAILLTANGKAFCAGQDLAEVIPQPGTKLDLGAIVAELYNPIIETITSAPKPVIAAVTGVAAGAGANLALACDFVICGESTNFIQAFSKVGLIPDSGGTFFLPRLVGLARAKALTFLGEKISAKDLLELGAIFKVVSDADVHSSAAELAASLASGPTFAFAQTKKLLNNSFANSLPQQLLAEESAQRACGFTQDYTNGVTAFAARKAPTFCGK